jgi:anti-sigma factor RsiW
MALYRQSARGDLGRNIDTPWALIASLLLVIGLPGETRCEEPGTVPARGVFPIICFPGPPADDNILAHWQEIKEANFTLVLPVYRYTDADQLRMLDHCEQLGLKAVVNVKKLAPPTAADTPPPGWRGEVQRAVGLFGSHPALFGYMIRDEPGADLFPQMGRVARAFRDADPRHAVCANLFPTHATTEQLAAANYDEYLRRYLETVNPPFLCYDHYPFLPGGKDRPDFFLNLALARRAALRHGKPLWTFVLSSAGKFFRTPSAGEMRWQVYGALAYGVKGYGYFTYWPARDGDTAIVDYHGNATPLYEVIRDLNSEVLAMGPVLLQLKSTAVYHTGPTIPEGCQRLPEEAPLQLPAGTPLLAGFFEDANGMPYAMLVNRNYREPVIAVASLSSRIDAISMVNKESGQLDSVNLTGRLASFELPAGGGVLLRLSKRSGGPR